MPKMKTNTISFCQDNENDAKDCVDQACGKLLCNKIMESYSFSLEEI